MEQNDAVLFGHLVLYHVVDAQDQQQNIQLWHSDYSNNGSKAIIDVRFIYTYSLCPVHVIWTVRQMTNLVENVYTLSINEWQ